MQGVVSVGAAVLSSGTLGAEDKERPKQGSLCPWQEKWVLQSNSSLFLEFQSAGSYISGDQPPSPSQGHQTRWGNRACMLQPLLPPVFSQSSVHLSIFLYSSCTGWCPGLPGHVTWKDFPALPCSLFYSCSDSHFQATSSSGNVFSVAQVTPLCFVWQAHNVLSCKSKGSLCHCTQRSWTELWIRQCQQYSA